MSAILLVFFLNGYGQYEIVPTLDDCVERGNELVSLGFIKYYQCASVMTVKEK